MAYYFDALPTELQRELFLYLDLSVLLRCEQIPFFRGIKDGTIRKEWWIRKSNLNICGVNIEQYLWCNDKSNILTYLNMLIVESVIRRGSSFNEWNKYPIFYNMETRRDCEIFLNVLIEYLQQIEDKEQTTKYYILKLEAFHSFMYEDEYYNKWIKSNFLFKRKSPAGVYIDLYKILKDKFLSFMAFILHKGYQGHFNPQHNNKTTIYRISSYMIQISSEYMTELLLFSNS